MKVFKNISFFALVGVCLAIGLSGFTSGYNRTETPAYSVAKADQEFAGFRFFKVQHELIHVQNDFRFEKPSNDLKPDNSLYQLIHWNEMDYHLKR